MNQLARGPKLEKDWVGGLVQTKEGRVGGLVQTKEGRVEEVQHPRQKVVPVLRRELAQKVALAAKVVFLGHHLHLQA
jgi:hypothetical protein